MLIGFAQQRIHRNGRWSDHQVLDFKLLFHPKHRSVSDIVVTQDFLYISRIGLGVMFAKSILLRQ
jgi:hypothetical protein